MSTHAMRARRMVRLLFGFVRHGSSRIRYDGRGGAVSVMMAAWTTTSSSTRAAAPGWNASASTSRTGHMAVRTASDGHLNVGRWQICDSIGTAVGRDLV